MSFSLLGSMGWSSRLVPSITKTIPVLSRGLADASVPSAKPSLSHLPIPPRRGINKLPTRFSPSLPLIPQSSLESFSTPADFLKAIGRSSEKKLDIDDWKKFWNTTGADMKKAGLAVRDRRYILWCMWKYRLGVPTSEFVHEAKPKKTIRGWGPAVQNGKRIRSRRMKTMKSSTKEKKRETDRKKERRRARKSSQKAKAKRILQSRT